MPTDSELYLPILVGSTYNYKPEIDFQRDDIGENISAKNPNYNELTAIYWAWKNLSDVDAVGLVHYRRLFSHGGTRSLNNVVNRDDVESLLENTDVIVPKKRHYYIESNYTHYIHAHHALPLEKTRSVLEEKYPDYVSSFDMQMKKHSAHMFNMFIMKKMYFDQYCEWLFSILKDLESRIDISEYSTQEARVFGYVSELLLDVWMDANHIQYREMQWQQMGDRKLVLKAFNFLKRKFSPSSEKQSHF
ncbi:lipopolysaccharide biosynthesis glycosyltransferase [Lactiplantibacillus plantarum]|nr:lipopolysaccharide biosynthesis glycosyltransferase [Lactiplantibacillus plantarum]